MKLIWILVAGSFFASSESALADTVVSSSGTVSGFTNSFSAVTPSWINSATQPVYTPTTVFWNNPSDDTGAGGSHMMNVGDLLTDSGGFAGTPPVLGADTVASELTGPSGADPLAFNFVSTATAYNISLLFADSSLDTGNAAQGTSFGFYVGNTFTPLYTPLDTDSPMDSQAFDPVGAGDSYGFYATVCYGPGFCETYTTGEGNFGNVTGAAAWNHFALFQLASGSYVIGFEDSDALAGEMWGDFNDVVVELQVAPEPGAFALMTLGIFSLLFLRAAKRRGPKRNPTRNSVALFKKGPTRHDRRSAPV